MPERFWI